MDKQQFAKTVKAHFGYKHSGLLGLQGMITPEHIDYTFEYMKDADTSRHAYETADDYAKHVYRDASVKAEDKGTMISMGVRVIHDMWSLFMDVDAVKVRDDSVFCQHLAIRHEKTAKAIARYGRATPLVMTGFSQWDYGFMVGDHGALVAAFAVYETEWDEYTGEFTDPSSHEGLRGIMVFSDGVTREMIMESTTHTIMSMLSDLSI